MTKFEVNFKSARVDTFLFMVVQITGKMFDHPIEKDCVQIYPIRQLAGPESAAIKNLAAAPEWFVRGWWQR